MKTISFFVEHVRNDKDEPVVTLLRTPNGEVFSTCKLEEVGVVIANAINTNKDEKK